MTKWKHWPKPAPLTVAQMIPFDSFGNVLVMHRAPGLRSAANVWSFPSGMQDIGEPLLDTARRELHEEYGLAALKIFNLGFYENIAGDTEFDENMQEREQYHWMIQLFAVEVLDVTQAVNSEPEKHDIMKTDVKLWDLQNVSEFLTTHNFHSSFDAWWRANGIAAINKLCMKAFGYDSY